MTRGTAIMSGATEQASEWHQDGWSPWKRLLAGAAGIVLMDNCIERRTPGAVLLGTLGFSLFVRAITNMRIRRLLALGTGRRGVDVHKAIIIEAPIEQVFSCWAEYDNFPRFLSGLREVHSLGNGQSRWVARGPEGMPIAWNAFLTEFVPGQMLAWRSDPDSIIPNTGMVRFEPHGAGNTRVDLRLCYEPLAGDLGDFAAELFGADERSAMDEDLLLLKALLEEAASRSSSSV